MKVILKPASLGLVLKMSRSKLKQELQKAQALQDELFIDS